MHSNFNTVQTERNNLLMTNNHYNGVYTNQQFQDISQNYQQTLESQNAWGAREQDFELGLPYVVDDEMIELI